MLFSKAITAKVHLIRDQYDRLATSIQEDCLLGMKTGLKRQVCAHRCANGSRCLYTITQVYRAILSHLTTTLVEMSTYINQNPNHCPLASDLTIFGGLADKFHITISDKSDTSKQRAVSAASQTFLQAVGSTEQEFTRAYGEIFNLMHRKVERKMRLGNSLPTCLLAVSGLPYNNNSRNKPCDWEKAASGLVAEAFLLQTYRKKLLDACGPARALRITLHDIFIKWILFALDASFVDKKSGHVVTKRWEFADNIEIGEIKVDADMPDVETLQSNWQASMASGKGSKSRKRDPIEALLDPLKKSKYLHCSEPGVASGTQESIVAFAMAILGMVSGENTETWNDSDVRLCRLDIETRLVLNTRTQSAAAKGARRQRMKRMNLRMRMRKLSLTWQVLTFPTLRSQGMQ